MELGKSLKWTIKQLPPTQNKRHYKQAFIQTVKPQQELTDNRAPALHEVLSVHNSPGTTDIYTHPSNYQPAEGVVILTETLKVFYANY